LTISLFWHLVRLSFKQQLAYRLALWAGLATNLFFGVLRAVLLIALYGSHGEVNGLSLQDAITYVGLTQAMIAFLTVFGSFELMNTIISGAIGSDLLKPVSFFVYWAGRDLGKSLVNLFGRGVFFLLIYSLFYPLQMPGSGAQWIFLLFSLLLAWGLSFAWRFLLNLAAFWSPDSRGILRIGFTLTQFLSGFIMPLRLLPDWFTNTVLWTPFPSMVDTSVQIFLGTLSNTALWNALLLQLFWFLVLAGACQWVLRAGVRRLVIQGG
jgi:ABC-2 type transport system permease protein